MGGFGVGWWGGCQAQPPISFGYSFTLALTRRGSLMGGDVVKTQGVL